MHHSLELPPTIQEQLLKIWQIPKDSEILDITAFGDLFIQHNTEGKTTIELISLTDGKREEVTELVEEFGLPPVSLDLGDEWYQLSALNSLQEFGLKLDHSQCFAFIQPVFKGGDYGPENIQAEDIVAYHQRIFHDFLINSQHKHLLLTITGI